MITGDEKSPTTIQLEKDHGEKRKERRR